MLTIVGLPIMLLTCLIITIVFVIFDLITLAPIWIPVAIIIAIVVAIKKAKKKKQSANG